MAAVPNPFVLPPLVGTPLGHLWTIKYHLRRRQKGPLLGVTEPFAATFSDPLTGDVTLTGCLHHAAPPISHAPEALVVLIHGLGGSAESGYMFEATRAALASGCAVLRVSLRGADVAGADFYHAGLYADVLRVLQHETVQRYHHVYVLGISLGGHVVLRTAGCDELPRNVRAVASLCPPLDLAACSAAFDKKRQWVFRRHILDSLKQMYARFAAQHTSVCHKLGLPSARQAHAIASIGDWDRSIVAPRHGFASATEYYATQSAGPRLGAIHIPALVLTTRWDPMVPHHTTAHLLRPQRAAAEVATQRATSETRARGYAGSAWEFRAVTRHVTHVELAVGGHIAFPERDGNDVLEQTVSWLKQHAG